MTLLENRTNVRSNLKIDPKKKIWSDDTLDRFINQGQRWVLNDPSFNWPFSETIGYLIPDFVYQEYIKSSDDLPENFFSRNIRQILKMKCKNYTLNLDYLPESSSGASSHPSSFALYADKVFLNSGYDLAPIYTTIHSIDDVNGNGVWIGSNDATNLSTDASIYKEGSGSLKFDIDITNSTLNKATLTNSTFTSVDLSSNDLNDGGIIFWIYLSNADSVEGFEVLFGSDSNNYYSSRLFKADVQGNKYQIGWNRIFLPTINRKTLGAPSLNQISYLQINILFSSSQINSTEYRIDNIQYVNKYLKYFYTKSAENLISDSSESIIPSEYQYIYELFATYKALSIIPGKEQVAQKFFEEAKFYKNVAFEELAYKTIPEFKMFR